MIFTKWLNRKPVKEKVMRECFAEKNRERDRGCIGCDIYEQCKRYEKVGRI